MANKNSKGNPQNFIPLNRRPKEEARKIQSKGGKKSQQVQKEKKAMNEVVQLLLNAELSEEYKKKVREMFGENIGEEYLTTRFLLVQNLFSIVSKKEELPQNKMAAIKMITAFAGESPGQLERQKAAEQRKSEVEDDPFSQALEAMFGNGGDTK